MQLYPGTAVLEYAVPLGTHETTHAVLNLVPVLKSMLKSTRVCIDAAVAFEAASNQNQY